MPEEAEPKPSKAPVSEKTQPPVSSIENLLEEARNEMVKLREIAELAKASAAAATEAQKMTVIALNDAQAKLVEITTAATQALASKTRIVDDQAVIAAKSDHIQKAQEHADKVRAELDRVLTAAILQATETEAQKSRAQLLADNAGTLVADIRATKESGDAAKAAFNETVDAQRIAGVALADAQSKLIETAAQAVAAKTQITDAQAVITTKSEHIQAAQEHADKVRVELDRSLTVAKQQATEAEGLKARTQSATDSAAALLVEVRTTKGAVESDVAAIVTVRRVAEESSVLTKALADKSSAIETRVSDYEKRLAELDILCTAQLKLIEDLLPGATAAGLASAFDSRRKMFEHPHTGWQRMFVGSLVAIVLVAATGLWHVMMADKTPSYDELLRLWLARLPIVGALVWLALHASRESALAKRLEEDYGYKAAVASCLMGFQKQMAEVGKEAENNPSLAKLLDNTLMSIASPPGRIYDKHELTVTPSGELTEATKALTKLANTTKPES